MADKYLFFAAVFLVLRRGEEVLLMQRSNTGHEDGNYGLMAGHIEAGETAQQALIRESREEIGIDISKSELVVSHVMHRYAGERTYFDVFIEVREWEGTARNMEPGKCSDISWVNVANLPTNTIDYIRNGLEAINNGVIYSNFGWK